MTALLALLFFVGGITAILGAVAVLRGFVLSQLWAWFVVPSLSAPSLSLGEAIGIALVISFFTVPLARDKEVVQGVVLGPAAILALGFILHAVFGVG